MTQVDSEIVFKNSFKKISTTSKMLVQRNQCSTAVVAYNTFWFGWKNCNNEPLNSCEVYSRKSHTWLSIVSCQKKSDALLEFVIL